MIHYFLDSSAVVKRYLSEAGTDWVRVLCDPASGNTIIVASVTMVEVAAALAARHRASGGIEQRTRDNALTLFLQHFTDEYLAIDIDRAILNRAMQLTQQHRLRGYDAIQLASALSASQALQTSRLSDLTFVAADTDLLAAAVAEGLHTHNPNLHG